MEEVQGDRGKLFILDNCIYKINKHVNGVCYYTCKTDGCYSRATQSNGEIISRSPHNHEPEDLEVEKIHFREELRQLASSNILELSPRQIYDRVCERYMQHQWVQTVGPATMSVNQQVHRTNNALESFYSALVKRMGPRPGMWDFQRHLRRVELAQWRDLERLSNGIHNIRPRRRVYVQQDINIHDAQGQLNMGRYNEAQFLHRMAHCTKTLVDSLRGNRPRRRIGAAVANAAPQRRPAIPVMPPPVRNPIGPALLPAQAPAPVQRMPWVEPVPAPIQAPARRPDLPLQLRFPAPAPGQRLPLLLRPPGGLRLFQRQPLRPPAPVPAPVPVPVPAPTPVDEDATAGRHPGTCSVCLGARATHVVIPCGHLCVCAGCAQNLRDYGRDERCPLCRAWATGGFHLTYFNV